MTKIYISKIILGIFMVLYAGAAEAQIKTPVTWVYAAKKIANNKYELEFTAIIESKWHIYTQDADGPAATTISFTKNPLLNFDGKVKEIGNMKKEYDNYFKATLKYYERRVRFVQKVSVKSLVATVVKGTINFVVCNGKECIPPEDIPFSINVGGK